MIISDNFAPWYLKKQYKEYQLTEIYRGWWVVGHLIGNKELPLEFLDKLERYYPKRALINLRRKLKDE